MPTKTLLQVVQDVCSDAGLDEVTSISDTVESLQIANLVKGLYFELVAIHDLPREYGMFQLDATGVSSPTVLSIPADVTFVQQIEYDKRESLTDSVQYGKLTYIEPAEFFRKSNQLDESTAEVELVTHSSGVTYKVRNDIHPTEYTIYNNRYVLCNSYFSTLDNNLQQSKTRCLGEKEPAWSNTDSHAISLDNQLMQLLQQKATVRALSTIKEARNPDIERSARRLEIRAQTSKDKLRGGVKYPNYGR